MQFCCDLRYNTTMIRSLLYAPEVRLDLGCAASSGFLSVIIHKTISKCHAYSWINLTPPSSHIRV